MKTLIIIGGFLWLGFFVFRLFFWKLFGWGDEQTLGRGINRSIIQVLNLCLIVCFLIFAYLSIVHTDELLTTALGRSLIAGMVIFGLCRVIEQFVFFDLRVFRSKLVLLEAMLIGIVYAIPLFV